MIPAFLIELPLRSGWEQVERLREASLVCLATVSADAAFREQLAMVVGELLENAVKYGDWEKSEALALLRVGGTAEQIEVRVTHPLAAGADVSGLMATLESIRAAPSPFDAYVQRMHMAAERTEGSGGLGLARIAFEANCTLSAEREGSSLCVRAVTRPGAAAGALHPQ